MFRKIYGHENIKFFLSKVIEEKKFANTYLFSGPSSVGKFSMAYEFAKNVFDMKFRNEIENFTFPDLQIIFPFLKKNLKVKNNYLDGLRNYLMESKSPPRIEGNENIPIDVIREIIQYANRKPYISQKKIIIIKNIEKMRKEGANSFLKLLEEPPQNTIIILTTDNINAILPTIVSRCQVIKFGYLSNGNIKEYFRQEKNINDTEKIEWFFDGSLANMQFIEKELIDINKDEILKDVLISDGVKTKNILKNFKKSPKKSSKEKTNTKGYDNYFLFFLIKIIVSAINDFLLQKHEYNNETISNFLNDKFTTDDLYNILNELYTVESMLKKNINTINVFTFILNLFSHNKEVANVRKS